MSGLAVDGIAVGVLGVGNHLQLMIIHQRGRSLTAVGGGTQLLVRWCFAERWEFRSTIFFLPFMKDHGRRVKLGSEL